MHYYRRNIGDYHKKAGRLSLLQHGIYTMLIDACYDREEFPTMEEAIDWVWASTDEEIASTEFVLRKFFKLQPDGRYTQKRIEEEISEYQEFCKKQQEKGKMGGRPKKTQREPSGNPTGLNKNPTGLNKKPVESQKKPKPLTTNHQPLTTNHGPLSPKQEGASLIPSSTYTQSLDGDNFEIDSETGEVVAWR